MASQERVRQAQLERPLVPEPQALARVLEQPELRASVREPEIRGLGRQEPQERVQRVQAQEPQQVQEQQRELLRRPVR